jgi:nucleotide-binding universal stress UspA family protein
VQAVAVVDVAEYWGGWRGTAGAYTGRWPAPPEDLVASARAQVQRMVDEAIGDGPVTALLRVEATAGHPAKVLLDAAKGADLLVIGHRGRGVVRSVLLGSVGLHCVLHAPCPVTIVRAATASTDPVA